jgi:hypothetical protein
MYSLGTVFVFSMWAVHLEVLTKLHICCVKYDLGIRWAEVELWHVAGLVV